MRLGRWAARTLAVMVTVGGLLLAAAAVPTGSPEDRAFAWAKSLSATERPTYVEAERLAELPPVYRKALFSTLSTPDQQVEFWRSVFTAYHRQHALSLAQESALENAEIVIAAAFHAGPSHHADHERAVIQVRDRVGEMLGLKAERELFSTAGPDRRENGLPIFERGMLHALAWSHTNIVARAASRVAPALFAASCNCNADNPSDCHYETHCTQGLNNCGQSGGCNCTLGIFDCWTCDGVCNYDIQN